jgi:hypothetical protein
VLQNPISGTGTLLSGKLLVTATATYSETHFVFVNPISGARTLLNGKVTPREGLRSFVVGASEAKVTILPTRR